jgi:hypothetical protein
MQATNQKEFDLNRKHTAGQFLRAHPEALKVMRANSKAQEGKFTIGANFRMKGEAA